MESPKNTKLNLPGDESRVIVVEPAHSYDDVVENLIDFSVTTDSVVATATVVTDRSSSRIAISWGDGEGDTLRLPPGVLFDHPPVIGQDDSLPKGTYQFSHAYNVSEDGRPFNADVDITVNNTDGPEDFRHKEITLTPRYKVIHHIAGVNLPNGDCDEILIFGNPFGDGPSFKITQRIGLEILKEWEWSPKSLPAGDSESTPMPGSALAREMEMMDGGISIRYKFTEIDAIWNDVVEILTEMHPRLGNDPFDKTTSGDGCDIQMRFQRSTKLIVPLPPYKGPVFAPLTLT